MDPRSHLLDDNELAAWDRARLNVEDLPSGFVDENEDDDDDGDEDEDEDHPDDETA